MSRTHIHPGKILKYMREIIPKLSNNKHKGQCGKICVIGGSKEYTGAPYFSGISALYCGADLVHVICPEDAAIVIKSYSPELIVHPILHKNYEECCSLLSKMHAVVIGPGLGRDHVEMPSKLIEFICDREMPLVIDADALHLIASNPHLLKQSSKVILTPNIYESRVIFNKLISSSEDSSFQMSMDKAAQLAIKLNNVTVVMKGPNDLVSNGNKESSCDSVGSPRRCGGQGDLLCGVMALFYAWTNAFLASNAANTNAEPMTDNDASIYSAIAACYLTRQCASLSFDQSKSGRNVTTSQMIDQIDNAFYNIFIK